VPLGHAVQSDALVEPASLALGAGDAVPKGHNWQSQTRPVRGRMQGEAALLHLPPGQLVQVAMYDVSREYAR